MFFVQLTEYSTNKSVWINLDQVARITCENQWTELVLAHHGVGGHRVVFDMLESPEEIFSKAPTRKA
jgi:hypothetical protein